MTMTNARRAQHGKLAAHYGTPDCLYNDEATNIVDSLANMMHYAEQCGYEWSNLLDDAERHFNAEVSR